MQALKDQHIVYKAFVHPGNVQQTVRQMAASLAEALGRLEPVKGAKIPSMINLNATYMPDGAAILPSSVPVGTRPDLLLRISGVTPCSVCRGAH